MKEKELRIALVCYGGISLAIYMHGVAKEIWKLVRASRSEHDGDEAVPGGDSEAVYRELLAGIGGRVRLRVLVDVIAGASAGGINGVLLARALAHDLSLEPLTALWLDKADVERLMSPANRARRWSKWFLRPVLWLGGLKPLRHLAPDPELRDKMSLFVRSRWFRPPFDGRFLLGGLVEAMEAMGRSEGGRSLLPPGQPLDLFVTATDFHGYPQRIALHDPPSIVEREHRHVLHFHYRRPRGGSAASDFADGAVPGLAFAARATAAFPGAFPPAQLREVDRFLADTGRSWPDREAFLARNFRLHRAAGAAPEDASFIDGSVLNNKPFAEAVAAIYDRPAFREVDRRVVFVEPDPREEATRPSAAGAVPGFFRTLLAALAHIPRQEPVRDDLTAIAGFNQRMRQVRGIVDAARPEVAGLVDDLVGGRATDSLDADRLADLRDAANTRAVLAAGFAYRGYLRLKLTGVEAWLAAVLAGGCGHPAGSAAAEAVARAVARWRAGRCDERAPTAPDAPAAWAAFLLTYDVGFRVRRLRFLIRSLNGLYARRDEPGMTGFDVAELDRLKARLYQALALFRSLERGEVLPPDMAERACIVLGRGGRLPPAGIDAPALADLLLSLAGDIDLRAANRMVDEAVAAFVRLAGTGAAAQELLMAYVGFAFWDVMTFAISAARDLGEFDEIRVDRISPDDAVGLRRGGARATLKGIGFGHFAAFFSRAYRENDYLWGRLHAAERLIDIVADAARAADPLAAPDVDVLRRRAFAAILAAEAGRLPSCAGLIADLRRDLAGAAALHPPAG